MSDSHQPLKMGMVGGGQDAFIGAVHRAAAALDGQIEFVAGVLGSHLPFGDHRRGWDFRSVGRGDVDFDGIIRALNRVGYEGPLSVEWEDPHMHREHGAMESCEYVRSIAFRTTHAAFDDAFQKA